MRAVYRLMTIAGVGAIAFGCGDSQGPIIELPRELSVAEGKLVEADNKFAFKLFREVNEQDTGKNIFISPLSVGMALGMTYNGAAGATREAMQEALELQGMTIEEVNEAYGSLIDLLRDLDPQVEFLLANSIWYRNTMTFEQEFLAYITLPNGSTVGQLMLPQVREAYETGRMPALLPAGGSQ